MKLFSQSPRWCHLTTTLWSLIALECGRNIDIVGVTQFLEVIHWRAHGKVTEEEFSVLYSEWMMLTDGVVSNGPASSSSSKTHTTTNTNVNATSSPSKKKGMLYVPVTALRGIVMEKNYTESDLDLFIGMIIHEANLRLLNTTISFVNKKAHHAHTNKLLQHTPTFSLEVVTPRWIALCEELFFCLDTPGYGVWKFDEAMFFCACITIGLQSWKNEFELEADLATSTLTATTLQFMRETGANVLVSSTNVRGNVHWDQSIVQRTTTENNALGGNRALGRPLRGVHPAKQEITLVMLKRYLVKKNVGETELTTLVQHIKFCTERLIKLVKANGAEDFYLACQPVEHRGSIIGSPRLWQESILIASGFTHHVEGAGATLPPVLLFLLTDSERHLSGTFKAIEFLVDDNGFVDVLPNASLQPPDATSSKLLTNPLFSATAANDELHENAYRLVMQFRKWSQDGGNIASTNSLNYNPLQSQMNGGGINVNEIRRDPIYQLILTALIQYKTLQQLFNAALFDFCINQYGSCPPDTESNANGNSNTLIVLCANLTPNAREVLVELGLEEAKEVTGSEAPTLPNDSNVTDDQTMPPGPGLNDNASVASSFAGSKKIGHGEESSVRGKNFKNVTTSSIAATSMDENDDIDDDKESAISAQEGSNVEKIAGGNKISDLAVAGRRKSTLMQLDQQQRLMSSESKQTQGNNPTTATANNNAGKSNARPNYFKPTATYLAKSSKGKAPDSGMNQDSDASIPASSSLKSNVGSITKPSLSKNVLKEKETVPPQPRWENVLDARPPDTSLQMKVPGNSLPSAPERSSEVVVNNNNNLIQGLRPPFAPAIPATLHESSAQINQWNLQEQHRYASPSNGNYHIVIQEAIPDVVSSDKSSIAPSSVSIIFKR
jgi:hypothetical protein